MTGNRKQEISIVRELAKQYMEIAVSDRHVRMRQRFRDSNDLKIVRPPLIMEEIPWHEMNLNGELDCACQDEMLRGMEYALRIQLFRERHFACDNYISTVGYKPQNLIEWAETAATVLDEYYEPT